MKNKIELDEESQNIGSSKLTSKTNHCNPKYKIRQPIISQLVFACMVFTKFHFFLYQSKLWSFLCVRVPVSYVYYFKLMHDGGRNAADGRPGSETDRWRGKRSIPRQVSMALGQLFVMQQAIFMQAWPHGSLAWAIQALESLKSWLLSMDCMSAWLNVFPLSWLITFRWKSTDAQAVGNCSLERMIDWVGREPCSMRSRF